MVNEGAALVTGASGFLGRMVAATLLANERVERLLPIRDNRAPENVAPSGRRTAIARCRARAHGAGPFRAVATDRRARPLPSI